jgi:UDP-N-acetylmuramate: L-alanyl-gamma-D-glutamyl-meso-diaminopimelate ligase
MLLHAIQKLGMDVDFMVGAQLDGYDCMVKLSDSAKVMILEGDEYLSSPIDSRPKFHLYQPNVAILSGIAWDHINVFPTFENYVKQFDVFCSMINDEGTLVYNIEDPQVVKLADKYAGCFKTVGYSTPEYSLTPMGTLLYMNNHAYELRIFGAHNLQNLIGAMRVAEAIGIENDHFLAAMQDFTGAGKRLQKVIEKGTFVMYKDFAHSPSKLRATTKAVKEQYPERKVIACMELHTFSSLKKEFLPQYRNAMQEADEALVYFSPEVVAHKKLEPISKANVSEGFGGGVEVMNKTSEVLDFIHSRNWHNAVLLMMSSGNFDGIDYDQLGFELT